MPVMLVAAAVSPLARRIGTWRLRREVRRRWHPRGIYMLWVHSESPQWKDYCERNIHPRICHHAVALNWSQRSRWWSRKTLAVRIFKHWSGVTSHPCRGKAYYVGLNYNPLAVVFPPDGGDVIVLQFYHAFRDIRRTGLRIELDKLERRLDKLVRLIEAHKACLPAKASTSP